MSRSVWMTIAPILLFFLVVASGAQAQNRALTLSEALARALERSPRLTAFAWDIRAADARILQAGLRPNPELSVDIEDVRWTSGPSSQRNTSVFSGTLERGAITVPQGQGKNPLELPVLKTNPVLGWETEREQGAHSGLAESEITVSLAYVIELGAKRTKRVAVAERDKDTLLWDYEAARADVLTEAATAFLGALVAQQRLVLEEDLVELAEEAASVAARRVKAGAASPLESNRADVALATTRVARDQAKRDRTAAYARLASMWGSNAVGFDCVSGTMAAVEEVPPLDVLNEELTENPDIARWAAELARRETAFQSERAKRIPNLTVQLGFRSTGLVDRLVRQSGFDTAGGFGFSQSEVDFESDRDNRLILGFSLPLPIFDRNQGNIAAAEHMVAKASNERRGAEAIAWALLADAREAAAAAVDEIEVLTAEVVPKAEETFEKTQRGYEQGKFSYLDVLDAQRTLFDVRTGQLNARARYNAALIEVERLTGRAIQDWPVKSDMSLKEKNDADE